MRARSTWLACLFIAACAGSRSDTDASRVPPREASVPDVAAPDAAMDAQPPDTVDAAGEAGEPDATPSLPDADAPDVPCAPAPTSVTFQAQAILEQERTPDTRILTGSIRAVPGTTDLLVSEPELGRITRLHGCAEACQAEVIDDGLVAPVRAQAVDFDADGDEDLIVADIGILRASTEQVGRVLWLEHKPDGKLSARTLIEGIGRIACAEAADLDGDPDLEVVVCEYGLLEGAIFWLDRSPDGDFIVRMLREEAGAIHAFPFDAEGDGDLDLAVALSERAQAVLLYRNHGGGDFHEETLFRHDDERFGLSGIELADLDSDGFEDILVTSGDYFDETFDFELHGLAWLRSHQGLSFTFEPIVASLGAYAVRAADMDRDCDLDLVLASMRTEGLVPASALEQPGLIWLQNEGLVFEARALAGAPTQMIALEVVDFGPGPSIATGSFTYAFASATDERLILLRREQR